jgi:hypothetical protein
MVERLVLWAANRYVGGPARSWIYASVAIVVLRWMRSKLGRQRVVELRPLRVGERIVIEQLPISHQRQIKEQKSERRTERRAARRAARSARREAATLSSAAAATDS